jgi:GNAT superfamily N-acetyltransferase
MPRGRRDVTAFCLQDAPATASGTVLVREAGAADRPAVRGLVTAAYAQYADVLPPALFRRYLADLLDLDRHAAHGVLLVADLGGRVVGSAAFYPDIAAQGMGGPAGWAGGRALAVHPAARGAGAAQALLAAFECRARAVGAPVFAFHTGGFMTGAIALYEELGYRRAPRYDLDLAAHYGVRTRTPVRSIAFRRDLRLCPA